MIIKLKFRDKINCSVSTLGFVSLNTAECIYGLFPIGHNGKTKNQLLYSSLSDNKQRNDSILEKILIFHKLYQNCQNYMVIRILCINFPNFFNFLRFSLRFCKCCHFFVFHRSVSCKSQDNREFFKKKDDTSTINDFIDFVITF